MVDAWGRLQLDERSSAENIYSAVFDAVDFDMSGELSRNEFVKVQAEVLDSRPNIADRCFIEAEQTWSTLLALGTGQLGDDCTVSKAEFLRW